MNQPIDTTAAEAYEEHMVPGMFLHWTELAVGVAAPQPGERVLDVACGTGIGARLAFGAVQAGGTVAGLDLDAGVIEIARRLEPASTGAARARSRCRSRTAHSTCASACRACSSFPIVPRASRRSGAC